MNVFTHLLWAVANSVWQSAAIAALAWGALRLARRTSAALRYSIWSGVLLAAACLPAINFIVPARVVSVQTAAPTGYRLHEVPTADVAPANVVGRAQLGNSVVGRAQLGETAKTKTSIPDSGPVRFTITAVAEKQQETPLQLIAAWSGSAAASAERWASAWAAFAFWTWAFVATLMLVRLGIGFARLRRIKNGLVRLDDADIVASCSLAARPVTVGASDDVECPCVIGYARPVVALPAMLVDELDRTDLGRVLAHELGHIRRWDDWANLFQQIVRSVWFFNPIVHVACRALDVDREIACDDLVAAGHSDRLEYAKCLTEIARRTTFAEHLVPAAGFFPDRRQIVVRIEQLLDRDHLGTARVGIVPLASAAVLLIAVLALAKNQVPAFAMVPPVPPAPVVQPLPAKQAEPIEAVVIPAVSAVRSVAPVAAKVALVKAAHALAPKPKLAIGIGVPVGEMVAPKFDIKMSMTRPMAVLVAVRPSLQKWVASKWVPLLAPVAARMAAPGETMVAPAAPVALVVGSSSGDFLDALAAAGYTHLSVDDLISIRNAGVTSSYLRSLKQFGIMPMPVSKLIALANAGVDADFIAAMHAAGYAGLTADDLISLSNAGVTPRFVQAMTTTGRARPTPGELISLANAGVSPAYVQSLAKYGYATLSVDSLIALANAGVSSTYVMEMSKQGYTSMSVDTMTALANAGVAPSYVKSLSDLGYSKISTNDLIRLANAGVTARLITTLRSHGIGDKGQLSVDELIKLANEGF